MVRNASENVNVSNDNYDFPNQALAHSRINANTLILIIMPIVSKQPWGEYLSPFILHKASKPTRNQTRKEG
jgi:hypothetical protein